MAQVDAALSRGMEAERLSVYFEEIGAYQYRKNKELQSGGSSGGGGGNKANEVTELELGDDPDAMIDKEE